MATDDPKAPGEPGTAAAPRRSPRNPAPSKRRLRVYAFDPGASVALDTAVINNVVLELNWDKPWNDPVEPGPINEYLEVIDYDAASRTFYEPINLNDPVLLAQDGLPLSEGRPQFHQQMVFAVAMKTIEDFERALGRPVFWAQSQKWWRREPHRFTPEFVKRLRIYPHAMRQANAYYSPDKCALLFGYFKGEPEAPGLEGSWVFTCLSADIVAHETSHAILHGMRRRSVEASNPDSLAFHEGFADIVALMQHFTLRRVVEHELARTGGVLRSINLLTGLASQFGRATGRNGALRQALETLTVEQLAADRVAGLQERGRAAETSVKRLADVDEPHDRGQFLVAAIFDAFVTIYERRTSDLFRIAGVQPGKVDALPDRLVTLVAQEACKTASAILQMCVRGLDYLPAVAPTFGEYLRAIMTADTDLYPDDPYSYRVAIAESFRKRGIPVPGCLSYAPDSLCWEPPDLKEFEDLDSGVDPHKLFADALGEMTYTPRYPTTDSLYKASREQALSNGAAVTQDAETPPIDEQERDFLAYSTYRDPAVAEPNLRDESMRVVLLNQAALHDWIERPDPRPGIGPMIDQAWEGLLGLKFVATGECGDLKSLVVRDGKPAFEVHSVRIARRRSTDGRELQQLVAQVTQRRRGYFDPAEQTKMDRDGPTCGDCKKPECHACNPDFWLRGGATIVVNLQDGRLTHIVRKRIDNAERLASQRRFILGDDTAMAMAAVDSERFAEPFAFLHGDQ